MMTDDEVIIAKALARFDELNGRYAMLKILARELLADYKTLDGAKQDVIDRAEAMLTVCHCFAPPDAEGK